MGELITNVIDIPDLIGYTRELSAAQVDNLLTRLVPNLDVPDIEYELQNMDIPTFEVARFRAWDTAPPLGKRPGFVTIKGEIIPLGLSMKLNEREIIRFNTLRAGLAGKFGTQSQLADVYDDALQTALACRWRLVRAIADMLVDGKVTISENGLVVEADYAVPGTNIVTAGVLWSDATNGVPITNLKTWQGVYRAANGGRNPAAWIISTEVANDLLANAQIKNLAYAPTGATAPAWLRAQDLGVVLSAHGIAPFVVFDGEAPNPTTGVMERLISARKVIGVPAGPFANVLTGTHPMSTNLMGRNILRVNELPGIVTWVEEDTRPASIITTSEAVALPVLRDPKALFVATV